MCSVQNVYLHVVCGSYLCGMCVVCVVCIVFVYVCMHVACMVCVVCVVWRVCAVCAYVGVGVSGCGLRGVCVYVLLSRVCDVPSTHGVCVGGVCEWGVVHPEFTVESQARQRDVGTEVGVWPGRHGHRG